YPIGANSTRTVKLVYLQDLTILHSIMTYNIPFSTLLGSSTTLQSFSLEVNVKSMHDILPTIATQSVSSGILRYIEQFTLKKQEHSGSSIHSIYKELLARTYNFVNTVLCSVTT